MAIADMQKQARAVPTHVVNKFLVEHEPGAIRLTFGEGFGEESHWHWAQRMSLSDAMELTTLISEAIRKATANNA